MGEDAALGLERTEAALREYADQRGLVLAPDPLWPGYEGGRMIHGPIGHGVWSLAGKFPGGASGRLRHQATFGSAVGMDFGMQHTIFVSRIPQVVGFLPMLNLRAKGIDQAMFAWAGEKFPREKIEFESIELGRKYVIEVVKGQGRNWLYQLFSPTFIDWLASNTPPDFGFRLDQGVFTCECPQWRGQETRRVAEVDPDHLDLLARSAGRVASRIVDEIDEKVGTGGELDPDSADAYQSRTKPKRGWLSRKVSSLGGGDSEYRSENLGAPHGYGQRAEVADFHARTIRLPLPGTATGVAAGVLPATGAESWLAWIDWSSPVDVERKYLALAAHTGGDTSGWVDDADATIPGFGDALPAAALELARRYNLGLSAGGGYACALRPAAV